MNSLELGIMSSAVTTAENKTITSAKDVINAVLPLFPKEDFWRERCHAIMVDTKCRIIGDFLAGIGTTDKVLVEIKHVVFVALQCNAHGVILAHNHPSGDSRPGACDIKMTEDMKKALSVFDIPLMDHVIIGDEEFYSFAEETKQEMPEPATTAA